LHVSAKDLGTGKEQSIKITAPTKLSKDEVEKMVKDAERFAAEDKKRKEEIEVKNEADAVVYSAEKSLKDHGDKVSADERLKIERAIADAKEALKSNDLEKIKKAKEEVMTASHKLAEEIYKEATKKQQSSGPSGQPQGQTSSQEGTESAPETPSEEPKKKDDVIDADYKEEK